MVPKRHNSSGDKGASFRAVLFRMVPKQGFEECMRVLSFRAVLFRMVPKRMAGSLLTVQVF